MKDKLLNQERESTLKIAFLCPFDLKRLTGTPIRTNVTIRAAGASADVSVIAREAKDESLWAFARRSLRIMTKTSPDIVHGITTAACVPLLLYKLLHPRTRIIFEMHGWAWYELAKTGRPHVRLAFLALDLMGLFAAHRVIAMSDTQRDFMSKYTWDSSRIRVIWGPVDFDMEQSMTGNSVVTVGYLGNAAWWQGLPALIDSAHLLSHRADIKFRIGGFDFNDEVLFPRLKNIEYSGRVERMSVPMFLRGCDILVSSRLTGNVSDLQYPQKLSEYFGSGRAVIVSNTNDQAAIVRSADCGFIVEEVSGRALAEAIEQFANMSAEKRAEMGRRALVFAKEHFEFDAFAAKLRSVYSEV